MNRWDYMCTSKVNTDCSVTKTLSCYNNSFIRASAFGGSDDDKQYDDYDDDTKGGWFALIIRDLR